MAGVSERPGISIRRTQIPRGVRGGRRERAGGGESSKPGLGCQWSRAGPPMRGSAQQSRGLRLVSQVLYRPRAGRIRSLFGDVSVGWVCLSDRRLEGFSSVRTAQRPESLSQEVGFIRRLSVSMSVVTFATSVSAPVAFQQSVCQLDRRFHLAMARRFWRPSRSGLVRGPPCGLGSKWRPPVLWVCEPAYRQVPATSRPGLACRRGGRASISVMLSIPVWEELRYCRCNCTSNEDSWHRDAHSGFYPVFG